MIGVFDSGIGGLSVLRVLRKAFPRADFVYFGDTARVPYGTRSEATIRQFASEGMAFLKARGCEFVVIACNTVSAVALDVFVDGGMRVLDVISPTIESVKQLGAQKVGVIGTSATVGSHVYARKLQEIGLVGIREVACPLFVPLIEEGFEKHTGAKLIAETYLREIAEARLEALILGCTHYPFMEATIAGVMGKQTRLVESGPAVLQHIRDGIVRGDYAGELFDGKGGLVLALTDDRVTTVELARRWLGESAAVEKIQL